MVSSAHRQPTALLAIDVQRGFHDPHWGRRNNPASEANISRLVAAAQERAWWLVLVRHDSVDDGSPLRPGLPGNALMPMVDVEHDLLVCKSVHSAFHGAPDLDSWLRAHGVERLVICGMTTNHCCETSARVAANLGYEVTFVIDATHTYDRQHPDGSLISAETIARVTAANLHGEFASVVTTETLLKGPL